jgi:hypothetical protein
MTHPITPPPELVRQWIPAGWDCSPNTFTTLLMRIADNAALWSHDHCRSEIKAAADQELEACVEWIAKRSHLVSREMQAARRPRPKAPSLKKQALGALSRADKDALTNPLTGEVVALRTILNKEQSDTIRKALEQLND